MMELRDVSRGAKVVTCHRSPKMSQGFPDWTPQRGRPCQYGGEVRKTAGQGAIRRSQQGSVFKQVFEGGGISGVVGVE